MKNFDILDPNPLSGASLGQVYPGRIFVKLDFWWICSAT